MLAIRRLLHHSGPARWLMERIGSCNPRAVALEIWDTHLFDGWQVEGSGPNKKVGVPIWKSKNHPVRDGFLLDGLKGRDLLTTAPEAAAGCATPP